MLSDPLFIVAVILYILPGSYPVVGISVVIVAPCPCCAPWHCVQLEPSVGDPVFPPIEPVELELEVVG